MPDEATTKPSSKFYHISSDLRNPTWGCLSNRVAMGSSFEGKTGSDYRTHAGSKVDLGVEMPEGEILAVEIKRTRSVASDCPREITGFGFMSKRTPSRTRSRFRRPKIPRQAGSPPGLWSDGEVR